MNLEKIIIISADEVKLITDNDHDEEQPDVCSCILFTCIVWIFWYIVISIFLYNL